MVLGLLAGPYRDLKDAPEGVVNVLVFDEPGVQMAGSGGKERGFVGNSNAVESDSEPSIS